MRNEISKFNCRLPKPVKVLFKKLYSQDEMLSVDLPLYCPSGRFHLPGDGNCVMQRNHVRV